VQFKARVIVAGPSGTLACQFRLQFFLSMSLMLAGSLRHKAYAIKALSAVAAMPANFAMRRAPWHPMMWQLLPKIQWQRAKERRIPLSGYG